MAGKKLQQAHDKRPRQPDQRRREGRAHAAQLIFQSDHQVVEDRSFLAAAAERTDRVDHRRHGQRQAPEGAPGIDASDSLSYGSNDNNEFESVASVMEHKRTCKI